MELDDVLSGKEEKEVQRAPDGKFAKEEPKEEPVVEAKAEPEPKAETVEPKEKPVHQEMTDKERGLLAAATEERRKRQLLEQELAHWRQQQQQPQQPQEPAKTFWDDPEGFLRSQQQTVAQTAHQAVIQARIAATETAARSKYPDFDAKIPIFAQLLQSTPGLHQYWLNQPDPAEFAYRAAKSVEELRQAGSVEAIRAEAEKAARIKLEAEYKAKEQALLKEKEALPESLSTARGTSQPRLAWSGPAPLESILKG